MDIQDLVLFWITPLAFFPPQGFGLYFWHSILPEVTENEDSVALRCFALWGFALAKNGFWRIFMVFQKKKMRSKRSKNHSWYDSGYKKGVIKSRISKFHKIEPIYFLLGSWKLIPFTRGKRDLIGFNRQRNNISSYERSRNSQISMLHGIFTRFEPWSL